MLAKGLMICVQKTESDVTLQSQYDRCLGESESADCYQKLHYPSYSDCGKIVKQSEGS